MAYDNPIENMVKKCSLEGPKSVHQRQMLAKRMRSGRKKEENDQGEDEEAFVMKSKLEVDFSIQKRLYFSVPKIIVLSIGKPYYP